MRATATLLGLFGLFFVCSCSVKDVAPKTSSANAYEQALQRIVLPGICDFKGQLADPVALFAWVASECQKYNSGETVGFDVTIQNADRPSDADEKILEVYEYKKPVEGSAILLPDAIKLYTAVMGLGYRFEENKVCIFSLRSHDEQNPPSN